MFRHAIFRVGLFLPPTRCSVLSPGGTEGGVLLGDPRGAGSRGLAASGCLCVVTFFLLRAKLVGVNKNSQSDRRGRFFFLIYLRRCGPGRPSCVCVCNVCVPLIGLLFCAAFMLLTLFPSAARSIGGSSLAQPRKPRALK